MAYLLENETDPVTFSCQATGEPIPNISWYFNSIVVNTSDIMINISNTSKYNISNSISGTVIKSALTIMDTNLFDVGNYTCHAENIFGDDQDDAVLVVNGKLTCLIISFLNIVCT